MVDRRGQGPVFILLLGKRHVVAEGRYQRKQEGFGQYNIRLQILRGILWLFSNFLYLLEY